ncbi:MAG: hypothetical protein CL678_02910 [Bdellovibrionaceae bacterium]|nr:hypothetical protein [Pseudobdellovibrionaceae bacterium]
MKNAIKKISVTSILFILTACGGSSSDSSNQNLENAVVATKAFTHLTTASNTTANITVLDTVLYPELANPSVKIIVSQRIDELDLMGTLSPQNDHPIAVHFSPSLLQWVIVNIDGTSFDDGVRFNVLIPGNQGLSFEHQVSSANIPGASLVKEGLSGNSNANIFVSPVYEIGSPFVLANTSVRYNVTNEWYIQKEDGSAPVVGEKYNVYVPSSSEISVKVTPVADDDPIIIFSSRNSNSIGHHFFSLDSTNKLSLVNENFAASNVPSMGFGIRNADGADVTTDETFNVLVIQ